MKNYFLLTLSLLLVGVFCFGTENAYALGSITHYCVSDLSWRNGMIDEYTAEEGSCYRSGAVIADIGLINWDNEYGVDSDSVEFKNKMIELAMNSNSNKTKLFALGWSDHVYQDENAAIDKIILNGQDYRVSCLILDKYIMGQKGGLSLAGAYIDYDLIRGTYEALCDFSPTDDQINLEIYNSLCLVNMLLEHVNIDLTEQEKDNAKIELYKIAKECGMNNPDYKILFNK